MSEARALSRDEIGAIWRIDRSESVEAVYRLLDGVLVLESNPLDVLGWPPGEAEKYTPILEDCFDRGGWIFGLFDDQEPRGVAVVDSCFMGKSRDQLQLVFLHVGRAYRDRGFGERLFTLAAREARRRGAKSLYVSATPSQHTVEFYLRRGCALAVAPDPKQFELEPEDIHLECDLGLFPE